MGVAVYFLRNLLLGLLVFLIASNSVSAVSYIVSSNTTQYSNATEANLSSGEYRYTVTTPSNLSGTLKISFDVKYIGGSGLAWVGLLDPHNNYYVSLISTTSSYVTKTYELSGDWSTDDPSAYMVRIFYYGWTSPAPTVSIQNVVISYSNVSSLVYGSVYNIDDNGNQVPIANAEVRLWNTSNLGNSRSYITGSSGSYSFTEIDSGTYYLQAIKTNEYDPTASEIITLGVNGSQKDLLFHGCSVSYNCFTNIVNPSFKAYNNSTGVVIPNATVIVTKYGESDFVMQDTTGTEGDISLKLLKTQRYNVTVISPDNTSVTGSWSGYPQQANYPIQVGAGISGTQPYNGSAYTGNTSAGTAGGISNFTSTYLNSSIGLGLMGQGILVGITSWFVVGAGGGLAALAVLFAYVYLGLISMVSLIVMTFTMISIYILRGKI